MCVCVCVFGCIQLYHMCRFMYLPPWSRYRTIPSSQGLLMLFCNHTHLLLPIPSTLICSLFFISKILSFQKCYINGIIQSVTFSDWLLSLHKYREIHSGDCVCQQFALFIAEQCGMMYHNLFNHDLLRDIWTVSSFWLFWIKLLWTFVYRFFISLG